jgi:hypothetical protein
MAQNLRVFDQYVSTRFTPRRSGGRDESTSNTIDCGAVRMCACHGLATSSYLLSKGAQRRYCKP